MIKGRQQQVRRYTSTVPRQTTSQRNGQAINSESDGLKVSAGLSVADRLIDALAAHWTAEGETGLAAMAARLHEIAAALKEEAAEGDGTVSVLCYTMF